MKIIALNKDKKHLIKVIFEDNTECFLDKDVCINAALSSDSEISEEELEELKYESDYQRAKSRALWYLDRMDYTEKALYNKLLRAGFKKKASAAVIARLVELGVIDDRRYAERFCEKCTEHNISKREMLHKMLEKGINYDLAKELIDSLETNEEAQIKALIEKKYQSKLATENGTQKVFAALARKGFSFSAIKNALKVYNEELEFSEEY